MKIPDKYVTLMHGYMRIKHRYKFVVEINWNLKTWAIPIEIDFGYSRHFEIRLLCVSFIFKTK